MSDPQFDEFNSLVDQPFRLQLPDGEEVPAVLTACTPTGPDGTTTSFSLIFKAGPEAPIEQATYQLSADGFGPEPVFLVPMRQLPGEQDLPIEYEAVFNRVPD